MSRTATVAELKRELATLFQEFAELMNIPDVGPNFNISIMGSPLAVRDLQRELVELGVAVPRPITIDVDWTLPEHRDGFMSITRRWVEAVPCRIIPLLETLIAELRRREERFSGEQVTSDMLAELQTRFSNKR